jgi:hypothetical protein
MNQQEKELFSKILELQTEIVDILIKIKEIEPETVLNLQPELFVKVDPVADLSNIKTRTRAFLKKMFIFYGFNEFNRNDNFVKDLIWEFRITDFSKLIHELEFRKITKITRSETELSYRINTIQFLKEIK